MRNLVTVVLIVWVVACGPGAHSHDKYVGYYQRVGSPAESPQIMQIKRDDDEFYLVKSIFGSKREHLMSPKDNGFEVIGKRSNYSLRFSDNGKRMQYKAVKGIRIEDSAAKALMVEYEDNKSQCDHLRAELDKFRADSTLTDAQFNARLNDIASKEAKLKWCLIPSKFKRNCNIGDRSAANCEWPKETVNN